MTVYYVMSDGVNDGIDTVGGYASRQTTDFATLGTANYYPSRDAVLTGNTLVSGDEIVYANTHLFNYTAAKAFTIPDGVIEYCVLYTDLTTLSTGAREDTTNGDIQITTASGGTVNLLGQTLAVKETTGDDLLFIKDNATFITEDFTLSIEDSAGTAIVNFGGNGTAHIHKNLTLNFVQANQGVLMWDAAKVVIDGGSVDFNGVVANGIIRYSNSGSNIKINNYDFSAIGSGGKIFADMGMIYDIHCAVLTRCKVPAIYTLAGTIASTGSSIEAYSLDSGSGYHTFDCHYYEGIVKESTTVKRTGGATYDGTNGFTAEFQPNANVEEFLQPLRYKLSAPTLDLSGAGGAIVEIHILLQDSAGTPTSLTDMNCVLKAVYPNATDLALGKTVSSTTKTVLDTPANLASETVTFTGTSGTTKQHKRSVTIPQNASMDAAVCELWLELSVDIPATTEMFVCPLHSLG